MRAKWYLIRLTSQDCTRVAKAAGPRAACKDCFGVIYDRGQAVYKQIPSPRSLSEKAKQKLYGSEGWSKIPNDGD